MKFSTNKKTKTKSKKRPYTPAYEQVLYNLSKKLTQQSKEQTLKRELAYALSSAHNPYHPDYKKLKFHD